MLIPFKPLKASHKLRIAYANGIRTVSEYARHKKRINGELPRDTIPSYMNDAINEQYEKEKQCN